jgi:hypothetical protein
LILRTTGIVAYFVRNVIEMFVINFVRFHKTLLNTVCEVIFDIPINVQALLKPFVRVKFESMLAAKLLKIQCKETVTFYKVACIKSVHEPLTLLHLVITHHPLVIKLAANAFHHPSNLTDTGMLPSIRVALTRECTPLQRSIFGSDLGLKTIEQLIDSFFPFIQIVKIPTKVHFGHYLGAFLKSSITQNAPGETTSCVIACQGSRRVATVSWRISANEDMLHSFRSLSYI